MYELSGEVVLEQRFVVRVLQEVLICRHGRAMPARLLYPGADRNVGRLRFRPAPLACLAMSAWPNRSICKKSLTAWATARSSSAVSLARLSAAAASSARSHR